MNVEANLDRLQRRYGLVIFGLFLAACAGMAGALATRGHHPLVAGLCLVVPVAFGPLVALLISAYAMATDLNAPQNVSAIRPGQ